MSFLHFPLQMRSKVISFLFYLLRWKWFTSGFPPSFKKKKSIFFSDSSPWQQSDHDGRVGVIIWSTWLKSSTLSKTVNLLLTYIHSPHIETHPMNQISPVSAHPSAVGPSPQSPVGGNASLFLRCDRWSQIVMLFTDKLSQSNSLSPPTSPSGIVYMCLFVPLRESLWVSCVWHINHQHNYIQNNASEHCQSHLP